MGRRKLGLVSVVVTSYNRKHYIEACLNGLIRQSYKNLEIIIVDDGSSDGTWLRIQSWKNRLSKAAAQRVVAVRLPRKTGYSGALTTGLFLTNGEFIAFHDSDDVSHRDRMLKQVRYLRSHPRMGMVGTNYDILKGGKFYPLPKSAVWLRFGSQQITNSYKRGAHCMSVGTLMIRGRVFDRLGGLTRRVNGAEDWELVDKFISHGVRGENLREALYHIRVHGSQRSRKFYGKQ